jgi:hypothetical protein
MGLATEHLEEEIWELNGEIKRLEQELHKERNQAAIREGQLGLRVDELEAALRESLESSHIDIDRLRGVLEAKMPKGRPVVHDASRHDPEIGSAGWTARLLRLLDGAPLIAAVGGRESSRWCVWTPGRPIVKSDETDLREALATAYGVLEAMEDGA